jgi:hypothetical protein
MAESSQLDEGGIFVEYDGELPKLRTIEPLTLEYHNVNFSVPAKAKNKTIYLKPVLTEIHGTAKDSTFTAIM